MLSCAVVTQLSLFVFESAVINASKRINRFGCNWEAISSYLDTVGAITASEGFKQPVMQMIRDARSSFLAKGKRIAALLP